MGKKRYRMTPRRRAAIKKAQAASARKRRLRAVKSGAKVAGYVVGASGASSLTLFVGLTTRRWAREFANGKRTLSDPLGKKKRKVPIDPSISQVAQHNARIAAQSPTPLPQMVQPGVPLFLGVPRVRRK